MLSYQHAYHAGNLADVHKHAVLLACFKVLDKAWNRMVYVESHAGRGRYDLHRAEAEKTGEWRGGIGALVSTDGGLAGPLNHYRKFVMAFSKAKTADQLRWYPGSPAIARSCLRRKDTALLHDLHPQEFAALGAGLAADKRFKLSQSDGLAGLQHFRPPLDTPMLAMIDPSYEGKQEFASVIDCLERLDQRGVILVWYPQLSDGRHEQLEVCLADNGVLSTFAFGNHDPNAKAGTKMYGSGMGLLVNGVDLPTLKVLRRQLTLVSRGLEAWHAGQTGHSGPAGQTRQAGPSGIGDIDGAERSSV